MGEQVAGLYMMALAGEASRHLNAPMVTDNLPCDVSSIYFNTDDGTPAASADGLALARLCCSFPQPENIQDVTNGETLRKSIRG